MVSKKYLKDNGYIVFQYQDDGGVLPVDIDKIPEDTEKASEEDQANFLEMAEMYLNNIITITGRGEAFHLARASVERMCSAFFGKGVIYIAGKIKFYESEEV